MIRRSDPEYEATREGVLWNGSFRIGAAELGPRGIRVLAVKPSVIETPGMNEHMESVADVMGTAEAFAGFREAMPLRRFGTPDEVARVVLFAASDQAAFLTGSVLVADGGELTI